MRIPARWRAGGAAAVVAALLATVVPVAPVLAAPAAPVVAQAGGLATLSGGVHDASGAPVPGATVSVSGPASQATTTDDAGNFTLSVPAGLYRVSISKGGYDPVAEPDVSAVAGTSVPLTVTMTEASLSTLQTIGSVRSAARASTINSGPAASYFTPGQAFSELAAPQINDVLARIPGLTVQQMGSQQDRAIVVGGVQPYETQVLIDGHPLALGQYGVWVSTYFPSFLVGGAEVQSGPGNTTPFANIAVGGTVNLLTPSYTAKTNLALTQGIDNYGSLNTTLLGSGKVGNLSYVVNLGTEGTNTPLTGKTECIVLGGSIIENCGPADGNLYQRGENFKLKYNFSPSTSFEAGFLGAWGGWVPQGTAWGTYLGPTTINDCAGVICGVPNNPYIGKVINAYQWYTGSWIYNNQTLWDAEFRTAIGSGTLLVRPYLGAIEPEIIANAGDQYYANFYGQPGAFDAGLTPGQPPPANYTPTPGTAEADCEASFGNITNPSGNYTVTSTNQFICYNNPYTTYEQDKLYGMTTSFIQPFGNGNYVNFTYDFHGQSTFAYIDSPAFVSVPFSTDRYSTFSLTGAFALNPIVQFNFGLYDTLWTVNGVQLANPADPTSTALTGLNRSVSHFDPHGAFVIRPDANNSYRISAGTSTTFPFVGQVSGLATYESPACSLGAPFADGGTLTQKNPNLNPETSIAYDAGADHRFKNNSVISADLQETVVHGVFEQLTSIVPSVLPNLCLAPQPSEEGVYFPANVAKLDVKSVTLKYNYAPPKGFGFNLSASAQSAILSGLTTASAGSLPANNVQICGPGTTVGAATCIPYLQGYGQITWTEPGWFVGLGVEYQGKNNAFFSPPFALVDLVARDDITRNVQLQLSVENLLNTNNYGAYLPIPNAGTPLVANAVVGGSLAQTSYPTALVPAPARYFRLNLKIHT